VIHYEMDPFLDKTMKDMDTLRDDRNGVNCRNGDNQLNYQE